MKIFSCSLFIVCSFLSIAQCDITAEFTSTLASCSTCCDAQISVSLINSSCPGYTYSWTPSDPNWPPGSACAGTTYFVEVIDMCGCSAFDTILVAYDTAAFLKENVFNSHLEIYPNPSSNQFYINGLNSPTEFSIQSIEGKVLLNGINEPMNPINISQFKSGTYLLIITINGIQILKRINIS